MPIIESFFCLAARDIHLTYPNGIHALNGVSLGVKRGEFVAIIGPNGSGKSSLMRAFAGLQAVDSGELLIEGDTVGLLSPRKRALRVAWVPQTLETLPGYTVKDFVLTGRYAHLKKWRLYGRHDQDVARQSLEQVNALGFLGREMDQMSGGERQRVMIARALAQESPVLLFDEPTSALDLKHQVMVYRLIHQLHRDAQRTIVVVTHDLNLASQFASRLVLMREGRIVTEGTPSEVLKRDVLEVVYGSDLAYGCYEQTVAGSTRPWVLPWARTSSPHALREEVDIQKQDPCC